MDIGPFLSDADQEADKANFLTLPDHITSVWKRSADTPYHVYWEVEITVHDDQQPPQPVSLSSGKELGFMLAYCDADSPAGREHFLGDVDIEPVDGDRNLGYIDASVFGNITLVEHKNP